VDGVFETRGGCLMTEPFYELRTPAVSQVKRFLEHWVAEEQFRQELDAEPRGAAERRGLAVDPEQIRMLWDQSQWPILDQARKAGPPYPGSPLVRQYLEFRQAKLLHADMIREESAPTDASFRAWRERQMARARTELPDSLFKAIVHPVFCCELSKGCSVGCWFCGVNAGRLQGQFLHRPENARLWRDVLGVLKHITGITAGRWGFLYWATDPFDNPDYEKFCADFCDVFGIFPHTTTAQPLKAPERTRAFLRMAEQHGCYHNRFSILTLRTLLRVHELFDAEELTCVELVMQNKESFVHKYNVGRAREQQQRRTGNENPQDEGVASATIACVSGFLLNMVERSVKLISPCNVSDRWPLGYIVHDEAAFADGPELQAVLQRMINDHMPLAVRPADRIRFRRDVSYEELSDGFTLAARFGKYTFNGNPYFGELGSVIRERDRTAAEIAAYFDARHDITPDITVEWLTLLLESGVLDEEPEPVPVLTDV
jgi:radical SAM family RiPP maturation amino acid epimerase